MKIMQWQRKIWFKLITNTVITTMLCQNVVWAGGGSAYRNIAPRSIFENFDKYFEAKGIDLPFHIKSKIFLGFTRISEKVFSLPPKDQDKLLESNNPYKEIENVFRYTDQNFEKYINFKENSIKIQTDENGNKFFSIDIEFIQSNRKRIPHNVIFYDSNRPPYKNLQGLSTTWTEIDEQYARERGFWISNLTTYDNYQSIPRMTLERGRIKSVFPFLSDSGIEEAIRRLRIIKEIKVGIPVKGEGGIVTGEEIKPLIDFVKEQVSKLNVGKIISIMLTGSYPWSKSPYDIDIMVYCENPPFSGKPDWLKVLQFAEKPNPDIGEVNAKLKFPEGIKPITSRLTISIFGGESRGFPTLWRNTIHIDGEKIDFPRPSDEDIMKYLINILNSLNSLMEQGSFSKVLSRLIRIYMLIDELNISGDAKRRGFNLMQWYQSFGDEEIPSFKFRERLEAEINYFKELVKPKGEVSSIEISLNEALGILDAFLEQTEDIPQPEFVGFGWGKEQITREFIQEYLPEILGLAKNELIAAHQLPDGRIRFTKLKEIYFSKKNGKSGGNVEEYLQAPEVQCPFGKSESFIIESILNLRKDFILSLLDSEQGQIWLAYCLRKVFVFDPPFKIKEIFLWAIMSGKDRIFTKLFYKALQDIDPAKAGLIVLFLLELCGEAEVIQELKQKKDELEFNIAILKDLLEEIALKWQLDQKDVPYLKVFFYKNLKNRGFLKQINMCSGEDENSCYLINEEIGTIVEITGDSPMNVIRIISEGLESSRLKFYFPDDLIPYIEYLLNLEDFYFPFREKIESEIKKRKSERRVITPKIRFMDLESLYKSTISGSHDKCNTEDFLLNYADNLRDAGIKDSDLIMEGIVLKHREICILLVPDIAESSVWEKRRCPYKVMGFIEGDYLYPLERDKRKIVENYLLSLPATEIKHYLCLSNRVGLLSPDVFVDLTTSDRDEIYIGHDLALENEVTEAIKDIDGSISIVDIGMGGGELLNRLTNRFSGDRRIKYFGNEPDPKLLKLAKLRLPEYVRLFSVDGEYLSQADFIEDLKGTYKIAILEGILTRGVTEPSKGQEILEGLFKIGFDRIFITGHTPVYINYEELETVLKKFGYKLERTLYPQNLFNFNKPKIMFVFCKVNRPALETFQVNDSNNKEKGPGIKSKPISDKPITEYRLDIQITKNGIFDLGRNEKNIIPGDSPLIFLGKELGVNFYVPISEKKEGYWKYKLNLTEYERKTIMEYDILPAYVEDKPTDIYIAFHNDIPLCIFCCDGISMLCYGIDPDLILNPLHSIASLWPKGDLIYPIVPADELFYYVRTKNMDRICVFKNGYRPDSASSVVLQEGIRPKKGSRVLILGAGTGADAILAARRGAGEVIATDIGLIEVICARYNVEKSGYKDRITVIQADLFNIPERLKKKKFTHIYFNIPEDPDMALLDRLLNEAGNYLEEGGTLEITYFEDPFFFEKVYNKGWEPIRIEGVNYIRENINYIRENMVIGQLPMEIAIASESEALDSVASLTISDEEHGIASLVPPLAGLARNDRKRQNTTLRLSLNDSPMLTLITKILENINFDYGGFVLVRQKKIPNRKVEISELCRYWKKIAEIMRLYDNGKESFQDKMKVLDEIRDKYKENDDFNAQLLVKGVNDLMRYIDGHPQKEPIIEPRLNRLYPEYILDYQKPSGAMKDIGRRSALDEDNIRLMKERQDKLEKKVDRLGIKTIIIKDLEITAKFISSSSLLPKGLSAWHFYDKRNNLVIVTRPEFQDEGIYHEAREAFWIKEIRNNKINVYEMDYEELERKIKEIQHKAHIIASAEQVLAFSENGRLAPFHKSQLDNMSPLELRALMREHDEYDVDNRKSYHYRIIKKYLGKNKYKNIKFYENLFRLRILLKLLKINKEIKKEFPMSKKGKTILLNSLISCTDEEVNGLCRKVSDIEGFEIRDRCALKKILFQWFDYQQLTSALRVDKDRVSERVKAGDIRCFVLIKGHRMYHPLIAIEEYVDYKENKNIIVKERYLKSSIEGLSNGSFKELIEFIEDEAGKKIKIDNINNNYDEIIAEVLNVCKTLFNINSFSRYLGLNKRSTAMLIRRLKLKKIDLKPKKGKNFTLISPQGAARVKAMREGLIKDVKKWHKDNFGKDIEFNNLSDFKEWSGDSEFIVTFPFIWIDSVKNIPGLKIYEVKDEYRLTNQKYYIPPIEIERLKNEVISLVKGPEVLPLLRKYKLLPDNMPTDNLDYEKAKGIIMEIKDKWLTILRFAKEIGYGKDLIYDLIERKEIDYIKLKIFTNQFVYYIPPENIEVLKNRDREESEKAKKFLEEVCNVYVFSLEHVKGLLEKHCMTTPQIVKRLGCRELTHTSERPNTVVLKFTGNPFLLVYWKREDAERFIENEKRKFEELKRQVSKYSDVTNISTPKKLIKLLKKEWKTPRQAMDLLNLSYNKVMHRVYKKKFPSVIMNLAGFGKRVYIYLPSGKGKIWAKGSGSLKDIGLPLSEEIIKEAENKEPVWRELAKKEKIKEYKIAIKDKKGRPSKIIIKTKVFEVNDLPQGLNAWHLREEDGTLVIVVRAQPDEIASADKNRLRNDSWLDELIYHEYREDYWMNYGLARREAHILASYEQVLIFAEEGKLTAYHEEQLRNMPIERLYSLINEYDSGQRKIIHHREIDSLVEIYSENVYQKIITYEWLLRNKAHKLLEEASVKLKGVDINVVIKQLNNSKNLVKNKKITKNCNKINELLSGLRTIFITKLSISDYVKIVDELKWWTINIDNQPIKAICQEILSAAQGSSNIQEQEVIVTTTQEDRYIWMMRDWLLDTIKGIPNLKNFIEVGVSVTPTEHLSLVSKLKEINPKLISLGLDILPIEDISYEVKFLREYVYNSIEWKFYCDKEGNILFASDPQNFYRSKEDLREANIIIDGFAKIIKEAIYKKGNEKEDFCRDNILSIKKIDSDLIRERILGKSAKDIYLRQGTFDTLRFFKGIDLIFSANTLRNYQRTSSIEYIDNAIGNAKAALREGGVFIEANSNKEGILYIGAISKKKNDRLVLEEFIFDLTVDSFATRGIRDMASTISTLFINNMIPNTPDEKIFEIADVIMKFSEYFRQNESKFLEKDYIDGLGNIYTSQEGFKYFIEEFTNFLKREGFNAFYDEKYLVHIRFDKDSNGKLKESKKAEKPLEDIISRLEEIVKKKAKLLCGEWSKLGSIAQKIENITKLQFAVPAGVLKNAGDFTLMLRKMRLLGKGNTIFELIVYDVDDKWDGDEFIKLLNLSKNIRVYTVKRGEINDSSDILQVKDFMQKSYPLRKKENGHLMIATNMMDEDAAESFKNRIKGKLDKNTSVGIIVKPDEKSIISLSRILADLLDGKGKDGESIIKIILPVSLSPGEIKKQLEEDLKVMWGLLTSA